MKKYYIMALMALCAVLATGCSDDGETVVPMGLKITASSAEFDAAGGSGQIEVQSDYTVSAISESPEWCTVSQQGKTIGVTVAPNTSIESRSTMIRISDESGSIRVPVYQLGDVFKCELADRVIPSSGESFAVKVSTQRMSEVSVPGLPEWLSYTLGEGMIYFEAQSMPENGTDREAAICITLNGKIKATATFTQYTIMKLEGTYTYRCQDFDRNDKTGTTHITRNADGSYTMSPMPFREGMGNEYAVQLEYSEETRHLEMKAGQYLENWSYGVYCWHVTGDLTQWEGSNALMTGNVTGDPSVAYVADGVYDENGKAKFVFKDGGKWGDLQVGGFAYMVFDGSYYWQYGVVYDLVLVKQ